MTNVFISYAREDTDFVLKVAKALKAEWIEFFFDQRDIPFGERFDDVIKAAIARCTHTLVILTPAAVASPWVEKEANLALELEKKVIPVLLKTCDVPGPLRPLNWADLRAARKAGVKSLCKAIQTNEPRDLPKTTLFRRLLTSVRTVFVGAAAALAILLAVYFLPASHTTAVSLVQSKSKEQVQLHLKNSGGWPSTVKNVEIHFDELPIEDTWLDLPKTPIVGRHSTLEVDLTKRDGFAPKNGLVAEQIAPGEKSITLVVIVRESDGAERRLALPIHAAKIWPFIENGLPTIFLGVAHAA